VRLARILAGVLAATALALCGCPQQTCPRTQLSVDELVGAYNRNAAGVPRLWARAKIAVTLNDPPLTWGSTSALAPPNGVLLLFKGKDHLGPHDFVLVGREVAGVELFRIGSSTSQGVYYFWYTFGEESAAFWGRHALAGAPKLEGLPLDPGQLLAVLGVVQVPDDQGPLPAAAMRMSTDPCAYVMTYIDRQPLSGRIGMRRDVFFRWSDDEPARPFRVDFLSPEGRRVLTARLGEYAAVAPGPDEPDTGPRPVMPTDIVLEPISWPGDEKPNPLRRVHIVLSEMTTVSGWATCWRGRPSSTRASSRRPRPNRAKAPWADRPAHRPRWAPRTRAGPTTRTRSKTGKGST
jgi:hypothetical protein